MTTNINALLTELAIQRQAAEQARVIKTAMQRELDENPTYQAAIEAQRAANEQVDKLTDAIKEWGRSTWAAKGGSKKICPGVSIRVSSKLQYDRVTALDWARVNLQEALALDTKFFETYAKGVATTKPVPGVSLVEVAEATIASNLDEYLPVPIEQDLPILVEQELVNA